MTAREEPPSLDVPLDRDPDHRDHCAPIRRTLTGEIEGLFRFAMARLGHRTHQAEDAVQQAVVIAMAHHSPPPDAPSQRAWLRGIVHNVIRRERRSAGRGRAALQRAATAPPASGAAGTDEHRVRLVQSVYLAVTELDRSDQDLFYAYYRSGRSQACIADELGTTAKGVEARLYRMRARLRAALDRLEECHA